MAISDKLNYLLDTKQLFKDRLNSLGANITSSTTFRNYLTWLDTFYGEVSDKTDISVNGVVGKTSQETTTGKNLLNTFNIVTGTRNGLTTSYDSETQEITINGTCNADNTQIIVSTDTIPFTSGTTKIVGYYVSGSITNNGLFRTFSASYQNYEGIDLTTLSSSNPTATKSSTFTGDKVRFDFRFDSGAIVTNFTIKLMITDINDTTFEKFTYGASPNPSYKQPINNLTGNVAYNVSGKNLITTQESFWEQGNIGADGDIVSTTSLRTKGYIPIKNDTNYNVSVQDSTNYCYRNIRFYDKYLNQIGDLWSLDASIDGATNKTINISSSSVPNLAFVRVVIRRTNSLSLTPSEITTIKPQIELGTSTTNWEEYASQTFNIPLGDIELCDIDTYEDKIYSSDGRFYLRKENGKELIDENANLTNLTVDTSTGNPDMVYAYTTYMDNKTPGGKGFCDKLINVSGITISTTSPREVFALTSEWAHLRFNIKKSRLSAITAQGFKDWLANNNLLIYYPLAIPTTTEITQDNYPSLYNALKQIQDYLTAYKINKEFILGYSSPEIEY